MEKLDMKRILHQLTMWMFALGFVFVVSCNDDDDDDILDDDDDFGDTTDNNGDTTFTGDDTTYTLNPVGDATATGTVTFEETEDGNVRVVFDIQGLEEGTSYPAYIYNNNIADPGDVAVTLESIDGSTGTSETEVSETDDGTTFTYEDVANFDGFINVVEGEADSTVILQADIGQNALTGESTSYALDSVSESGRSGNIVFHQRENDEVIAEITLDDAPAESSYPARVFTNTTIDEGDTAISLNNVENGVSRTNLTMTDEGDAFTYNDLENFNGNVRVGEIGDNDTTTISQADIGQNALSGNTTTYDLAEVEGSGISGTATYSERLSGQTRVDVDLTGENLQGEHPVTIYSGSLDEPGEEFATLNDADEFGSSATNVTTDNAGNEVTYSDMTGSPGYIQVHQDQSRGSVIAEGNVGTSAATNE